MALTSTYTLLDEEQPYESVTVTPMVAVPWLRAFHVMDLVLLPEVRMPWPLTDQL